MKIEVILFNLVLVQKASVKQLKVTEYRFKVGKNQI